MSIRSRRDVLFAVLASTAMGCTPSATDYDWGTVEGSLKDFFEDPIACSCQLELNPADWRIQYTCGRTAEIEDEVGYMTFYSPLPPTANQRGTAFTQLQFDRIGVWPSSGFGVAGSEMEFGSEEFGHPGLDDDTQVSKYREVFIWELDVPAQRICSVVDNETCEDIAPGHATELRFVCGIGVR